MSILGSEEKAIAEAVVKALREKIKEEAMKLIIEEAALKIGKYLRLMGKGFEIYKQTGVIVTEKLDGDEVKIYVVFKPPEWIEIRAKLVGSDEMPREAIKECNVLETLMMLSNDFAELSFCMDSDLNIYAKQNILVGALTFDVFKEEYDAVYISALIFRREVLPKLKKCVRDYDEIKRTYSEMIT